MAALSQPIAVTGTTTPEQWFEGTQPAVGPADAGATTVTVVDAADFDEGGGTLTIGDDPATAQTVKYTTVDDDTGVITLAAPLAATWPEGTRVTLDPPSYQKFAQVMVGDFGEAVEVEVPHELWNKIADGIRADGDGEVVTFHLDGGRFVLDEPVGQAPIVDGGYLDQQTTPPETFMDGSLYGMVGFVDGGFVAGDLLGANAMMSAAGFTAQNAAGERTFQVDALTGDVTSVGVFASSLTPNEAHIVMGDLAGSGASKSFVYFYTGQELNADGTPIAGAFPGQVSSGIDTVDGSRYIELRSPDLSTVSPGILTIKSSVDTTTNPQLNWAGDIRLRGNQGILYSLNASDARAPLTIQGSALVLDVPNGTMRLGDSGAGGNRLRSRDSTDSARRHLELEAQTLMLDIAGGNLVVRDAPGATGGQGQIYAFNGNVGIVWSGNDVISVTNADGGGYQPIAASAFNVNSDRANKTDIEPVDPDAALTAVTSLAVSDYTRVDNGHRQRGFMAQDVAEVLPVAVTGEAGDLAVELYALCTTIAAGVQALTTRVKAVEVKTANLPTPKARP